MRNDHLSRIGFQVRKPAPRPALRDAVVRNGVVYDHVPLSCAKIEPEPDGQKRNLFGCSVFSDSLRKRCCSRWGGGGLCAGDRIFPSVLFVTGVRASSASAEVGGLGREAQTVPRRRNLPRAKRVFLPTRTSRDRSEDRTHILLRKGAFKAGFETPLTGVVSYPYPTSNRSSNPALKWVF